MKIKYYLFCIAIVLASCTEKIDIPAIQISSTYVSFSSDANSVEVSITATEPYTINCESDWIAVENSKDKITISAERNVRSSSRDAVVAVNGKTVSVEIKVKQEGHEYEIKQTGESLYVFSTEAGLLYYHYKKDVLGQPIDINKINLNNEQAVKGIIHGKEKWNDIKKITIEGVTNAMDYACIKHNFQNVEYLDVSNTTIEAYTGPLGTLDYGNPLNYGADTFPYYAFCYGECDCKWDEWDDPTDETMWISMPNLKYVALPNTIKKIDFCAFKCAVSITEIIIPEGVIEIGAYNKYYKDNDPGVGKSFYNCISLEKVYLPSTLELLGFGSFINNDSLKEVHIAAKEKPKETIDEWYSNNKNVDYYMTFGTALDWLNMERLGYVGGIMVGGFSPLIYEPKTNATLYVPKGCKDNYKDWERYFQDIVEE